MRLFRTKLARHAVAGGVVVLALVIDAAAVSADVGLSGDLLAVSDIFAEGGKGVVLTFRRGPEGWSDPIELPRPDGIEYFGEELAVAGTTVFVSDPTADREDVHVYQFADLGDRQPDVQVLSYPETTENPDFGEAIAVHGDVAAIGAPDAGRSRSDSDGAVYLFKKAENRLLLSYSLFLPPKDDDSSPARWFGHALAMDDNSLIVGAPTAGDGGDDRRGSVYVFEMMREGQAAAAPAQVLRHAEGDRIGESVSLHGRHLAVGAPGSIQEQTLRDGTVLLFERDHRGRFVPSATHRLTQPRPSRGAYFGAFLGQTDDALVVSAEWTAKDPPGAVYVYRRSEAGAFPAEPSQTLVPSIPGRIYNGRVIVDGNTLAVESAKFPTDEATGPSPAVEFFEQADGEFRPAGRIAWAGRTAMFEPPRPAER